MRKGELQEGAGKASGNQGKEWGLPPAQGENRLGVERQRGWQRALFRWGTLGQTLVSVLMVETQPVLFLTILTLRYIIDTSVEMPVAVMCQAVTHMLSNLYNNSAYRYHYHHLIDEKD